MSSVAITVATGFEDSEFKVPYQRLVDAGDEVTVIGLEADQRCEGEKGSVEVTVNTRPEHVHPEDFDALVIPGGRSPAALREDPQIVRFVREFSRTGRTIAAICHGPQLLVDAEVVAGKTITSTPSIRAELEDAGATWIDQEVVEDGNLITSRRPDDLDAFTTALLYRL